MIEIRDYRDSDCKALADIFKRAVREIARKDYSRSPSSANERVASITSGAASRLDSDGPSQQALTNAINAAPVTPGTEAAIAAGATVVAGQDIQVLAVVVLRVTMFVGGFGGGFVGVGAAVSVTGINANASAHADGTLSAGRNITISSSLDETANITTLSGSAASTCSHRTRPP